ncbi:MAG TPA: Dyp-type peroxidase [Mycobacteriales bacterium]|nr:Dyp-type peroxidase [Mycobacteriales bacterium]
MTLELDDIQGILARGYGHLRAAHFTLFAAPDAAAARALLTWLLPRVTTAATARGDAAWNVAYTPTGLRRLGLPPATVDAFSAELTAGMADPDRSRALGDLDGSAPRHWAWGGPESPPFDGVILLYAADAARLASLRAELRRLLADLGVHTVADLDTAELAGTEPFGFRDGISQPLIDGLPAAVPGNRRAVPAGEFVLGYRNAYGLLTDRPLLSPSADPDRLLPADPDGTGAPDLGRNGSYLVMRQLAQDVDAFWRYAEDATRRPDGSPDPAAAVALAAKMVGRWPSGAPLVKAPDRDDPLLAADNDFGYHHTDPLGYACPLGAHVRRTNPRDSLDPSPGTDASLAVNDRHRLLRRGRSYGPAAGSAGGGDPTAERGLHFLCLAGNLSRQFEFVQHTWLNNPTFHGLYADPDPVVGSRPASGGDFTSPARPVRRRYRGLPRFVRTRGGAYFFLPGISALRYLAHLPGGTGTGTDAGTERTDRVRVVGPDITERTTTS